MLQDDGSAARIIDFDADEDTLVVFYDPELTPDPELTITTDADDLDAVVRLNGARVMIVAGAGGSLTLDDVTLVEENYPVPLFTEGFFLPRDSAV